MRNHFMVALLYRLDRHSFRRQSLGLEKHPRVTRFRFSSCRLPFGGLVESQTFQPAEGIPLGRKVRRRLNALWVA
ncbi:hypothetical protein CCP3SC1_450005 [Gammaproteobacteria bacterium]